MNHSLNLKKSDFSTVVELLLKAKSNIVASIPNIPQELAHAFVNVHERDIQVHLFIEFSEKTYRNGFGDIGAFDILNNKKNIFIKNKNGINLYFLIIDETGYFYFPKSSFHEAEGETYDLFPMHPSQVSHVKFLFGLNDNTIEIENILQKMEVEQIREIQHNINPIDNEEVNQVETILKNDPPLKPIFARTLQVYTAKFQFVELKFTGANLHTTKVKLPPGALPFKDENIRKAIEANLRIFSDLREKELLSSFFELKNKVEDLRSKYLIYVKFREKRIIERKSKTDFEKELKQLRDEIKKTKEKIINEIQEEIFKAEDRFKKMFIQFLKENPVDEDIMYNNYNLEHLYKKKATNIVARMKFPKANKLLDGLKLEYYYYDITWNDLNDPKFTKELVEKELLTQTEKSYIDKDAIEAVVEK